MSTSNPRKRNAPGAGPSAPMQAMPQPSMQQDFSLAPQNQFYFDPNSMITMNGANVNTNAYLPAQQPQGFQPQPQQHPMQQAQLPQYPVQAQQPQQLQDQRLVPTASNMVARVDPNRQAVVRTAQSGVPAQVNHSSYGATAMQNESTPNLDEDIDELDRRADRAKKASDGKLPPFVHKLGHMFPGSQYYNPSLIDWAADGKSFLIFDEEAFSRSILPGLYKHSNFASFVRQLNMYGFHKHVGIGQNSMRANESNAKPVHQYWHPHWNRDHFNWRYLISKSKGAKKSKGKSKQQAEVVDADDEDDVEEIDDDQVEQPVGASSSRELAVLPRSVQREFQFIKQNQDALRQQFEAMKEAYQRDQVAAQQKHARAEHSINAILTFLRSAFRQSIEGTEQARQFNEILAGFMANTQGPQGSVVDLGSFPPQHAVPNSQVTPRRQHLLPAPPSADDRTAFYPSNQASAPSAQYHPSYQPGTVVEIGDTPTDTSSPADVQDQPRQNPQGTSINTNTANNNRSALIQSPRFRHVTPVAQASAAPLTTDSSGIIGLQSPATSMPMSSGPVSQTLPSLDSNTQALMDNASRLVEGTDSAIAALGNHMAPLSPTLGNEYFGTASDINFDDFINNNLHDDSVTLDASHPDFFQHVDVNDYLAAANDDIEEIDRDSLFDEEDGHIPKRRKTGT